MQVIFTAPALDDLAAIHEYIGRENPDAASRIAVQIMAACDRLEYLPERGRPGLNQGTRELTILWPYVIVYGISGDTVEILRIWHGRRHRSGNSD